MSEIPEPFKTFLETKIDELNDRELANHIEELKKYRLKFTNVVVSVSEVNELLKLAISERRSRSSDKLARIAIAVASVGILLTIINLLISFKTCQ